MVDGRGVLLVGRAADGAGELAGEGAGRRPAGAAGAGADLAAVPLELLAPAALAPLGRPGTAERALLPPLATARAAADSAGLLLGLLLGGGTGRVASAGGRLPDGALPEDPGDPAARFTAGALVAAGPEAGRGGGLPAPGRAGALAGGLLRGGVDAWPGRAGVPLAGRAAELDEPDGAAPLPAGRAGPPVLVAGRPFAGPPDELLPPPETLGDASVVIGDAPPPGFGADVLAGRFSFSGLTSHLHAQQPATVAVKIRSD